MNERIQQLIEQATTTTVGSIDEHGVAYRKEFDKEKFAELLIKECVDKTFDSEKGIGPTRWKNEVMVELKEHFGVESCD